MKGFTLLEVLVALAILAGISLAVFGVTSQMVSSKGSTEDRDEMNHAVTLAMGKMSDDLNQAIIIKSKDLLGSDFDGDVGFEGAENRLDFVSFSHTRYLKNSKESELAEISYYLVPMPDEPDKKILMRREATLVDKNLQEGGEALPLLEGIQQMSFEYLDDKSKEWKKVWNSRSADFADKLPQAVKIQIEAQLPDEEEKRVFSTWAPIRMRQGPLAF